jgi:LuxR family maltose regulon positive regulatory protein
MLDLGLACKLILLSAPAGYGKTTLLSDWSSRLQIPCIWLSLDRYDNDLFRFLAYLHTGLQKYGIDIKTQPLSQAQPKNILDHRILVSLINNITSFEPGFVLILDDYHRIKNEQVHSTISFLLDNLPLNCTILIATRIDPPLQLARLRARGALCEIRAEELRFSETEAITFLNQSMKLGLETSEANSLNRKTEGWITGLQLAAISLRDNPEKGSFIAAFAGNDRHIADYLVDEALARQTAGIQDFLIQTAILDQLSAPLCDAITGNGDAREILTQLEQSNLFLIPQDNVREWYRYHNLFQDLLLMRLRQNFQAEDIKELHELASAWFLSKDHIIDAIHHAFEADDIPKIVSLIESNIFTILDQGKIRTLQSWMSSIPENYKSDHPWLNIAYALVLVYAGELDLSEKALCLAEETLKRLEAEESNQVKAYIFAIRAYALWIKGSTEKSDELASQALKLIPENAFTLRAFTFMVLGACCIQQHAFADAKRALKESIDLANKTGNDHIQILASSHLVFLLINQAKFAEAEQICQRIITQYENRKTQTSPAIAQIFTLLSDIYTKRFQLDEALSLAKKGLMISKRWNQIDTETVCYIYLIQTLITRHEFDQAREYLDQVKERTMNFSPWFRDIIEESEVNFLISSGEIKSASKWALEKGLNYRDFIHPTKLHTYINYARILSHDGRFLEALKLVDRLLLDCETKKMVGVYLDLSPLKSVILAKMGEYEKATKALKDALSSAEPEGYKRSFIQYGEGLVSLLPRVIQNGQHQEFALELLESIEAQAIDKPATLTGRMAKDKTFDKTLLESLSDRELEVLEWMACGCTNLEIAQKLVISLHTVKSHARNIYGKLGVKNRTEAVTRGRLLGLLE